MERSERQCESSRATTTEGRPSVPEDAPKLADWIEEELGDTELADFLRAHPEGVELLSNGEAILPHTVFDVVEDLIDADPAFAQELACTLDRERLFPELSYQKGVGNVTEEEVADAFRERKFIVARDRTALHEGQVEMSEVDRHITHAANIALSQLREIYGLPEFTVPDEAVRIIFGTDDVFVHESGKPLTASFSQGLQNVYFPEDANVKQRLNSIFHEFTHFHSYGSFQVDRMQDGGSATSDYRVGLKVRARQVKGSPTTAYLESLNEAVTEETANRLCRDISEDDPDLGMFAKDGHDFSKYITEEYPEMLTEGNLRPYWISYGKTKENGDVPVFSSYAEERNVMFDMFKKIYERNPNLFDGKSPDEAENELFEMLQKAMFTGNILPFGRLFNDTFGRGKFREFGHLQTIGEQQSFVEGL
ncbi:MAG: hypothetical protein A2845_00850 [Candidatus Lloydbacteria bacterium RIFCSPHIGHO2_01_FULL_49_22]|uniref:Uncharacterized protein n=1 Tax=Candidatus Lloydbacteria bacterium RIFCSPHIGHO2_01_FULL_49_22 TaxID=1798658 RepID=A0A1G2CYP2_9BACT|nr:MAG: hypothetical protein A2845_00850 [Candidatus Lloydbacteria bacterium RIFCSPHIGHO2_01_FULL_49_22]OGZ09403.1 MAG: hypothetical protein A3C14_05755 [Candidatus Lloydbacteria bacterium RIFCSPHIGHO2_02_FULL_50_18]